MRTISEGEATVVEMFGSIDERAQLGEVKATNKVILKLDGVKFLNSIGTRTWCVWIQRFRAPVEVVLEGCPVIFVKSISTVKGFLTDRCTVRSFYIPYYSETTGEAKEYLLTRGKEVDAHGNVKLPDLKDSEGNSMEIDVVAQTYFSFLKVKP